MGDTPLPGMGGRPKRVYKTVKDMPEGFDPAVDFVTCTFDRGAHRLNADDRWCDDPEVVPRPSSSDEGQS